MDTINRKIQPGIKLVDKFNFPRPEVILLDNGITLYQLNAGTQDITKIEFIFRAGSRFEEKPLVAKFTNKMLKEGTRSFTSSQIHETADYYGAHLELSSDKDMAYAVLFSLNKHLKNLMPTFKEVILDPVFPEKELNIRKQNKKQEFLINCEKVKFIARHKFNELLFGQSHPYGRTFGAEDFDRLESSDLVDFHNKNYYLNDCKVIISGKIPDWVISLLIENFGDIRKGDNAGYQQMDEIKPSAAQKIHIKKENAIQSALRIGKVLINKKHPDFLKMKVVNTVLGGYFGSRLMTSIREEKGYSYGIGSVLSSLQHAGTFFIASEVGTDVTDLAIEDIYKEIKDLQENKISEKELDLVRNYMSGSLLRSMDGPFALSDSLKYIIEYGLDEGYFKDLIETIKNISTEDIRELAQQYLDLNTMIELKVGK